MHWGEAITDTDPNAPRRSPEMGDSGAFTAESIQSLISDNERVRAAFVNPNGLATAPEPAQKVLNGTVALVVTDRRLMFATPDGEGYLDISHHYSELVAIDVHRGRSPFVRLTTTDGEVWKFSFPRADPSVVSAVGKHLQWIGLVRERVIEYRNDAEIAAGEIRSLADEMEWEEAESIYGEMRDVIDSLICAVQFTDPIDDAVLAPELTEIERTLEKAHVRLYLERSRSELELGQFLLENEDYDQAHTVICRADEYFTLARNYSDTLQRGDAFQFGTQRELNEEIQRLGWEIETVAAEPVRQAAEARIRAQATDDPGEAVECWERAYRRYGQVLRLACQDTEGRLVSDRDEIQAHLERAAEATVDHHLEISRTEWNDGVDRHRDGEVKAALERCLTAKAHLESAISVATDVGNHDVTALESRKQRMDEMIYDLRRADGPPADPTPSPDTEAATSPSASEESTPATDGEDGPTPSDLVDPTSPSDEAEGASPARQDPGDETAGDDSSRGGNDGGVQDLPTMDELGELDVHHDVTIDVEDGEFAPPASDGSEGDGEAVTEDATEDSTAESKAADGDLSGIPELDPSESSCRTD